MRSSPTAEVCSERRGNARSSALIHTWALDAGLLRRFIRETPIGAERLRELPPLADWPTVQEVEGLRLLVAAPDIDKLPWDALSALRRRCSGRFVLLLPRLGDRLWRRLTRGGWLEVLSPPFKDVDPDLLFAGPPRGAALSRRSPELEALARVRLDCRIPAQLRQVAPAAELVSRLARELGFPSEIWAEALPLTVDEALSNAIEHGCGNDPSQSVDLSVSIRHEVLRVRIEDPGPGFDPGNLADATEGEALLRPRGRGILIMRELLDRVVFEDGGRVVNLYVKRRPERPLNSAP